MRPYLRQSCCGTGLHHHKFRQVSVSCQYRQPGERRLRGMRNVRIRLSLQLPESYLEERPRCLLDQYGSVQRLRKLFHSLPLRCYGATRLQRGSHWTLLSSLKKNYSGQLIIVTGCGVFRKCSGCTSCITGSFCQCFADVYGILLQCFFMKLS